MKICFGTAPEVPESLDLGPGPKSEALGSSGKLWVLWGSSGMLWEALGNLGISGKLWGSSEEALGSFGKLWELWEALRKLWQALANVFIFMTKPKMCVENICCIRI